jgi:hypothetical protein
VYGYGESLHQAQNLIAKLLLEIFSIGTQRIGISVSANNLQFCNTYIGGIVLILELPTT